MATTATTEAPAEDPIVRLRTTHEGVTIEKVLVREAPEMVTVWFRLTANSRKGRRIRLTEALPEGVSHEDVGLHPDHGADDWTRGTDGLELSTDADQAPTVTMYAIRNLEVVPATLASPPQVVDVGPRTRSLADSR